MTSLNPEPQDSTIQIPNGVVPLTHMGIIRALGEQAAEFLQGQLTQDVQTMTSGTTRLAGYCTPKGRLLASFVVVRVSEDEYWLVCHRDLLSTTLKKLSMFVLRAKVKLSDASEQFVLYGLLGTAVHQSPTQGAQVAPLPPADGVERAFWLSANGNAQPMGELVDAAWWLWADVRSGVAMVSAPVSQSFVPQMINYESVDGVSFRKGCYPGQEVIARSQFRGAIKRRAFIGQVDGSAQAGQEVFSTTSPDQPIGLVAQAAARPKSNKTASQVIVSVQLSAAQADDLHIGTPNGPLLSHLHIPYPLRDDI